MRYADIKADGTEYAAMVTYGRPTLGGSQMARVVVVDTAKDYVRTRGSDLAFTIAKLPEPRRGKGLGKMLGRRVVDGILDREVLLGPRDIGGTWAEREAAAAAKAERLDRARTEREQERQRRAELDSVLKGYGVSFTRYATGNDTWRLDERQARELVALLATLTLQDRRARHTDRIGRNR